MILPRETQPLPSSKADRRPRRARVDERGFLDRSVLYSAEAERAVLAA